MAIAAPALATLALAIAGRPWVLVPIAGLLVALGALMANSSIAMPDPEQSVEPVAALRLPLMPWGSRTPATPTG